MTKRRANSVVLTSSFSENSLALLLAGALHIIIVVLIFSHKSPNLLLSRSNDEAESSFNVFYENKNSKSKKNNFVAKKSQKSAKIGDQIIENTENFTSSSFASAKDTSSVIYDLKALNNKQPKYPALAKRKKQQGQVLLKAFIDKSGKAKKIEVAKSSSSKLLDFAALDAVKTWKFIPAKKLGQAISSSVIIPVTFKLQ